MCLRHLRTLYSEELNEKVKICLNLGGKNPPAFTFYIECAFIVLLMVIST